MSEHPAAPLTACTVERVGPGKGKWKGQGEGEGKVDVSRLHIGLGRAAGIRPRDIVGAIATALRGKKVVV